MSNALISVSDKTGLVELAQVMVSKGISILSTGGTAKYLRDAGIAVRDVSDYTGFNEMMDGRVKTLHPKVHGGILCLRDDEKHLSDAKRSDIEMIDYVIINLYPFKKTIDTPGTSLEVAIENIDIGGPAMIRSSAKNHKYVTVVVNPSDYEALMTELKEKGKTDLAFRQRMSAKAFEHTFLYDSYIFNYLKSVYQYNDSTVLPLVYEKKNGLRYGENPHQNADLMIDTSSFSIARDGVLLHGKEMSYNNYSDSYYAYHSVSDLSDYPAVSIIKHCNPCGLATGETISEALKQAWEGDIVSAFGSIIAFSREFDEASADFLMDKFVEIIIAPSYSKVALEKITKKKKDLRLLQIDIKRQEAKFLEPLDGMLLIQDRNVKVYDELQLVSGKDDASKHGLVYFTNVAVKHIKSNAIAIGHEYKNGCYMLMGMGAGQPNRVDALRKLAIPKVMDNIERLYPGVNVEKMMNSFILASDAFFPFSDTVEVARNAGIRYIIQPGGSKNDGAVIDYCKENDITMWLTGIRHFLH